MSAFQEIDLTLTAADNGASIHCQGVNPASGDIIASELVNFTVYYPCGEPEMTMSPDRLWFNEGDGAELECRLKFVGNPPATLFLQKGNKTLVRAVDNHVTYDIDSFQLGDDGADFHCEARNDLDAAFVTEIVDDAMNNASMAVVAPLILKTRTIPVRVAYGPHHMNIYHGSSVVKDLVVAKTEETLTLNCSAWSSHPPPIVEWIRTLNGSLIDESIVAQNVIGFDLASCLEKIVRKPCSTKRNG